MDKLAALTGRQYHLFDYTGAPDADRVIVIMGSGAEVAHETVEALIAAGEKVGGAVREAVPAVCDRAFCGSTTGNDEIDCGARPHQRAGRDLRAAVLRRHHIAGRDGTEQEGDRRPIRAFFEGVHTCHGEMKGVFDELKKTSPKNQFTIGIKDDVTHTSLDYDPGFSTELPTTVRALFYGLGADGTVAANKNSIKIIGEETENFAQGYFVYDSKKSGSITTSHLRFGPKPIRSSYLIGRASFVACHQFSFLERIDVLKAAAPGATFLLNSPFGPEEVWDILPRRVQERIIGKKLKLYVIDGFEVARRTGMGGRINTIMQTCFFAISGVLPRSEAIAAIKRAIKKTYGKRGDTVVQKN
jgi:pyruvate-ferredoxin/flavodoxin oxidoreductase